MVDVGADDLIVAHPNDFNAEEAPRFLTFNWHLAPMGMVLVPLAGMTAVAVGDGVITLPLENPALNL